MANVDFVPFLAMVTVQVGYAGMMITSKLAMDSGMNPFVLVTYRQVFATLATIPFALLLERKTRPRITVPILLHIFLCSITGAFMNQVFYFVGLNNSTPTIACAMGNILPAMTFLFALIFRQESFGIKSKAGQAKVIGTLVCVGGAMLLSFYHGPYIGIGDSRIHWTYANKMTDKHPTNKGNFLLGPFLLLSISAAWALWFIIQAKLSRKFPAPYTTTTLMSLMASIECAVTGAAIEHRVTAWSLSSGIRLISAIYAGCICSALAFCVMSWCIERKGPLYTAVFNPLLLVITAILSWALLQEKLTVGILVGSTLIIAGLYCVLWGKDKEAKAKIAEEMEAAVMCREREDLELQLPSHRNGSNVHHDPN
ncbi:WAT1-related protein At1g09380-like [Eucalyptus grandis]|uniref:Uncharacterized protein n=2 Tax=Eucalyptus grandis TaxID=71139 RepID=A0ACC3JR01_EUCGR|nr:WAT1-related protein At1g09380-like [Eucalyptus grandis]KAK3415990.1 hypothetical protein EUGRSUZ_H01299 [Eucalyptus grandis]